MIAILIALLLGWLTFAPGQSVRQAEPNMALVTRVEDGNVFEVRFDDGGSAVVRYLGIEAPEPERDLGGFFSVQCFGPEAQVYNRDLLTGQRVRLERDVSDIDGEGRLLRYVYLADGTFVNARLVAEGYATAKPLPPNDRHDVLFKELETAARVANLGLWGRCFAR
jgi:micrococcal nuclease